MLDRYEGGIAIRNLNHSKTSLMAKNDLNYISKSC